MPTAARKRLFQKPQSRNPSDKGFWERNAVIYMEFFAFFGITIIFPMKGIYRSLLALRLPTTEGQARF